MNDQPKPTISHLPVAALRPHPRNPRTIKGEDFARLCESIRLHPDYFEARPIIASDRTGKPVVIAGNMRLKAAQHNGLKVVPVAVMSGLTEEREREIMIRDNVANGEWDYDVLADEFTAEELEAWGVDLPGVDDEEDDEKQSVEISGLNEVVVECDGEKQQRDIFDYCAERGMKCRILKL